MDGRGSSRYHAPRFLLRTVVEEKLFEEQKKKITSDVRRLDEILFGVTWAVARGRPGEFSQVLEDPDIYVIKTDSFPDVPSLRIFFTYKDEEVHLQWVEIIGEEKEV